MKNKFWSNKDHVEDLLRGSSYRTSVKTIGSGNRGVH